MAILSDIILIALGFFALIVGADFLVNGASGIAKKFHIPEIIIGLTIVSIGTSLPELFVSVKSAIEGYVDMSIGNVVGSNLCNLLLILGISAIVNPIIFKKETKQIDIPLTIAVTIIFWILCNVGADITRLDAGILIVLFLVFISYTIFMGIRGVKNSKEEKNELALESKSTSENKIKKNNEKKLANKAKTENKLKFENKDADKKHAMDKEESTIAYILSMTIGIIALKLGGDAVVEKAKELAELFNISEKVISLTIVAIGTSLPELVTSVVAAFKKNSDIAVGNILGSNIFNFLFIIGVAGLIKPISYNISYNFEMTILFVSTILLAIFSHTGKKDEMSRINGIIYLIIYAIYMILIFSK